MNPDLTSSFSAVLDALGQGLPTLVLQFLVTLALLGVGIVIYMAVTPFRERELLRNGNVAASIVLGGAVLGLAIPLAALLATSGRVLDILVWGVVALVLQLATFGVASSVLPRGARAMIEAGNVAAAIPVFAAQLAVGLLNAAAMVPA
jgi:putative membrane protein